MGEGELFFLTRPKNSIKGLYKGDCNVILVIETCFLNVKKLFPTLTLFHAFTWITLRSEFSFLSIILLLLGGEVSRGKMCLRVSE